jgi:membrane protease YdiL (CAAX protease family)
MSGVSEVQPRDRRANLHRSPRWQVVGILAGAPALQTAMFFASRVDLATFSRFAFVAGALTEYVVLLLVIRFLRQQGSDLTDIGWRLTRWPRELLLGVGLGVALFVVAGVGSFFVEQVLPSSISRDPRPSWAAWVYGFALVTAFAPIEEIVWRGYAITVLREQLGSAWAAVLLASFAFGLLHWWGGPANIFMAFVMGLAFSGVYLWRKNLTACVVAHFILDLPLFFFMLFPLTTPTGG